VDPAMKRKRMKSCMLLMIIMIIIIMMIIIIIIIIVIMILRFPAHDALAMSIMTRCTSAATWRLLLKWILKG